MSAVNHKPHTGVNIPHAGTPAQPGAAHTSLPLLTDRFPAGHLLDDNRKRAMHGMTSGEHADAITHAIASSIEYRQVMRLANRLVQQGRDFYDADPADYDYIDDEDVFQTWLIHHGGAEFIRRWGGNY